MNVKIYLFVNHILNPFSILIIIVSHFIIITVEKEILELPLLFPIITFVHEKTQEKEVHGAQLCPALLNFICLL